MALHCPLCLQPDLVGILRPHSAITAMTCSRPKLVSSQVHQDVGYLASCRSSVWHGSVACHSMGYNLIGFKAPGNFSHTVGTQHSALIPHGPHGRVEHTHTFLG